MYQGGQMFTFFLSESGTQTEMGGSKTLTANPVRLNLT